jgi:hypothetical protein
MMAVSATGEAAIMDIGLCKENNGFKRSHPIGKDVSALHVCITNVQQ